MPCPSVTKTTVTYQFTVFSELKKKISTFWDGNCGGLTLQIASVSPRDLALVTIDNY